MTILNIIDHRKRPYRFMKINAVIEPTRHDNACKDSDHANGADKWIGYDEQEHVSLNDAIKWAAGCPDEVTLYIYDEDSGIYPIPIGAPVIGRVSGKIREGDQVPGMPQAICHACGLGYKCADVDCPNEKPNPMWQVGQDV